MLLNNELGTINPIKDLAKLCNDRNIYIHTDAVQCIGKIPIDIHNLSVDMLSVGAHKFYGPKGIGVLFINIRIKEI